MTLESDRNLILGSGEGTTTKATQLPLTNDHLASPARFLYALRFPPDADVFRGPQSCRLCGLPMTKSVPYNQVISNAWTLENLICRPDSDQLCLPCEEAIKAINRARDGLLTHEPWNRARGYIATRDGMQPLGFVPPPGQAADVESRQRSGERARWQLLNPPEPPFLMVVRHQNTSKQKHQLLIASLSFSRTQVRLLLELKTVIYSPATLADLVAGATPHYHWPFPYKELAKAFGFRATVVLADSVQTNGRRRRKRGEHSLTEAPKSEGFENHA